MALPCLYCLVRAAVLAAHTAQAQASRGSPTVTQLHAARTDRASNVHAVGGCEIRPVFVFHWDQTLSPTGEIKEMVGNLSVARIVSQLPLRYIVDLAAVDKQLRTLLEVAIDWPGGCNFPLTIVTSSDINDFLNILIACYPQTTTLFNERGYFVWSNDFVHDYGNTLPNFELKNKYPTNKKLGDVDRQDLLDRRIHIWTWDSMEKTGLLLGVVDFCNLVCPSSELHLFSVGDQTPSTENAWNKKDEKGTRKWFKGATSVLMGKEANMDKLFGFIQNDYCLYPVDTKEIIKSVFCVFSSGACNLCSRTATETFKQVEFGRSVWSRVSFLGSSIQTPASIPHRTRLLLVFEWEDMLSPTKFAKPKQWDEKLAELLKNAIRMSDYSNFPVAVVSDWESTEIIKNLQLYPQTSELFENEKYCVYIHENKFVHYDLSTKNRLTENNCEPNEAMIHIYTTVKISGYIGSNVRARLRMITDMVSSHSTPFHLLYFGKGDFGDGDHTKKAHEMYGKQVRAWEGTTQIVPPSNPGKEINMMNHLITYRGISKKKTGIIPNTYANDFDVLNCIGKNEYSRIELNDYELSKCSSS